jgi:hypothetical protein
VRLASAAAVALVGLTIGGCADAPQEVETVTVEREVAIDEPPASPQDDPRPRRRGTGKPTRSTEFVDCDKNIQAKAVTTTCPFAQNVFWAYWTNGESSRPFQVWSPAVRTSFGVTCKSGRAQVVCTTSDKAAVTFPEAAVDLYSEAQADAYASSHDLGPDPYEDLSDAAPPPNDELQTGGLEDCQGYDPCIPPGGDVDCAGGSGDGPRYVKGPVYVGGADPYGLDSNYDGVGCES